MRAQMRRNHSISTFRTDAFRRSSHSSPWLRQSLSKALAIFVWELMLKWLQTSTITEFTCYLSDLLGGDSRDRSDRYNLRWPTCGKVVLGQRPGAYQPGPKRQV